jgi:hypothetical protein
MRKFQFGISSHPQTQRSGTQISFSATYGAMNADTWFEGTELEQGERAELASGCETPGIVSIMNQSGPTACIQNDSGNKEQSAIYNQLPTLALSRTR